MDDTAKKEKLQTILASLQRSVADRWRLGQDNDFTKVSINTSVPDAYLLKNILVDTLEFPCDYMPMEKVLWEIGFSLDGILCKVTSQKFGHRIFIESKDDKIVADLTVRLTAMFNEATAYLSTLLKDYAAQGIKDGTISVNNHYRRMKAMYEYFRDESLKKMGAPTGTKTENMDGVTKIWNASVQNQQQSFFLEQAAYFAFFGLLEHLLTLFLAFDNFDPATDNFNSFIFKPWSKKYKRVFKMPNDVMATRYYDLFSEIARRYRNPHAHGMITGEGRSVYFHLQGTGLLSAYSSESNLSESLAWLEGNGGRFEIIDNFLTELRTHPLYKVPMQIIEGGLDIDFSSTGRKEYVELIASGDASDFVEYENDLIDRHGNMDW
jgi:hypothetical protein